MQMNDIRSIAASREVVWAALNDPEVLKQCIPGCESLEMTSPTEMTATVVLKVGPVKAKFGGNVALSDIDPPNGYRITGIGSGGVAGFAKGSATVRLEADGPETTVLHYAVEAQVGGKLAQLGARLIDSTAAKLATEFFECFAAAVAQLPGKGSAADTPDGEVETKAKMGWFKRIYAKRAVVAPVAALAKTAPRSFTG